MNKVHIRAPERRQEDPLPSRAGLDVRFVSAPSPTLKRAGSGGMPCQGLWLCPQGSRPRAAFFAAHYDVDFSEHYLGPYLARRGFGFLGFNTRFRGLGATFRLSHALVDAAVGVRWLREVAGVERVILLGNSGGASLLAAYQAQAARCSVFAPSETSGALGAALADLPAGDGFAALCAHLGRPEVLTAWIDPSVVDETDPLSRDPSLDMFDRANGPPYSPAFVEKYRAAQVARNERITDWALAEVARLEAAGAHDRAFCVHRTWADLRFLDLALDPSDRTAGCYFGDARRANAGPHAIASSVTARTWLDMWSLRTSRCRAAPHLARLSVPSIVVQSTADRGCFPSDARAIHAAIGASDRALVFVPGDHYLEEPDGARDAVADRLAAWANERWPPTAAG